MNTPPGSLLDHKLLLRSGCLSFNFFLIILAYYQVKVASRSLFLEFGQADQLPWVWVGSGLSLLLLMPLYQRLLIRFNRLHVVLGSCLLFGSLMLLFRLLFIQSGFFIGFAFYLLVDILSVVLVEQFWSLTNSLYRTNAGKSWYGLVSSGGILGGMVGGASSVLLLKYLTLQTEDLLLVSGGLIFLIFLLTLVLERLGYYKEVHRNHVQQTVAAVEKPKPKHQRYLVMIALLLLLSQLSAPIVEYQLMSLVQEHYPEKEARSIFLSMLYLYLGLTALGINLVFTPLIQKRLGVVAGLLAQPLVLAVAAYGFMLNAGVQLAMILKIADRGLSYSINRASKELLYVPMLPSLIYRAKAWIDMVGYRLFKILASVLILLFTRWEPLRLDIAELSWLVLLICACWVVLVLKLRKGYYQQVGWERKAASPGSKPSAPGIDHRLKRGMD